MQIIKAGIDDVEELAALADIIWHQHFRGIISDEQIEYMIENFQSQKAMTNQLLNMGYEYYFFNVDGENQGYFAIQEQRDENLMFISKVYLKKEFRGRGYARKAFEFIENEAKNRDLKKTRLTVNRHNDDTIAIYKKLGMYIADEKAADIGNGFVMDDYIFEKDL